MRIASIPRFTCQLAGRRGQRAGADTAAIIVPSQSRCSPNAEWFRGCLGRLVSRFVVKLPDDGLAVRSTWVRARGLSSATPGARGVTIVAEAAAAPSSSMLIAAVSQRVAPAAGAVVPSARCGTGAVCWPGLLRGRPLSAIEVRLPHPKEPLAVLCRTAFHLQDDFPEEVLRVAAE